MPTPFDLIALAQNKQNDELITALKQRSYAHSDLKQAAQFFCLHDDLKESVNTAIAVGEPLILTGEAGTGKTQSAYYIAELFGLGDVLHFQVKSDTKAKDLLYQFDTVRYFHDAQSSDHQDLDKFDYLDKGVLWQALASDTEKPRVVLIDEIDKAPRDFPNDLLHEIDQMNFKIAELGCDDSRYEVKAEEGMRPIVFISSNSERQLPDAFLRRCVFHHISFDDAMFAEVIAAHHSAFKNLSDDFIALALQRFIVLHQREDFRKRPSTGELLTWLRTLALWLAAEPEQLERVRQLLSDDGAELPCLGVLFKDRQDLEIAKFGY